MKAEAFCHVFIHKFKQAAPDGRILKRENVSAWGTMAKVFLLTWSKVILSREGCHFRERLRSSVALKGLIICCELSI